MRSVLTLLSALALAACADLRAALEPEALPDASPPPVRAAPAVAPASAPPPQAAATRPEPAAADLLGRDAGQLDTLLGTPDLIRTEGDGEVRIYRSAECVLHVFVYSRDGARQTTHVEARREHERLGGLKADECMARFAS